MSVVVTQLLGNEFNISLGSVNNSGIDGFSLNATGAGNQIGITAGKATVVKEISSSLTILYYIEASARPIAPIVLHVDPITGSFSVSPTCEASPLLRAKCGLVTAVSDMGSGKLRMTSSGHGMHSGEEITFLSGNYQGTYVLDETTGASFIISHTLDGIPPGMWFGLDEVRFGRYVGLRGYLFPEKGEVVLYHDVTEYSTLGGFNKRNSELSRTFTEHPNTKEAVRVDVFIMRQDVRVLGSDDLSIIQKPLSRFK